MVLIDLSITFVDKSKKVKKKRKTNQHSSKAVESVRKSEVYQGEVFLISSGDEDSSKGMKSMEN